MVESVGTHLMFERTFTFWRRLVGISGEKPTGHDDRRLWIRYPSDLPTTLQIANQKDERRIPARIRNISRGGASLLVEGTFETGQLVNIELRRGPEEEAELVQLLACI